MEGREGSREIHVSRTVRAVGRCVRLCRIHTSVVCKLSSVDDRGQAVIRSNRSLVCMMINERRLRLLVVLVVYFVHLWLA